MKNLIALLLFFACFKVKSQDLEIGSTWIYDQTDFFPPFNTTDVTYLNICGDTTISGISYFKLSEKYGEIGNIEINDACSSFIPIREENNRIYFYDFDTKKEYIIYDFNLKKGDTFTFYSIYNVPKPITVTVDSIGFDQTFQKEVIYYKNQNSTGVFFKKVIKGIGEEFYFWGLVGFADPPPGGKLLCYVDSKTYLPPNENCFQKLDNKEIENTLAIYPNPTSDEINFSTEVNDIFVFNKFGLTLFSSWKGNKIDISHLSEGIYYLKYKVGGDEKVRKVVKL